MDKKKNTNFSKQRKTTLPPYWDSKLNSIIFNTGIKESEFIRKATIKEIEQTISKVPK
jgi:hypothetical protein